MKQVDVDAEAVAALSLPVRGRGLKHERIRTMARNKCRSPCGGVD